MKMKATNKYRKFSEYDFRVIPSLAKAAEKCLQIKRENRYRYIKDFLRDLQKANRSFTSAPPVEILHEYMKDPVRYARTNKLRRKFSKKHIITVSLITAMLCLLTSFVLIILKNDISVKPRPTQKNAAEQPKNPGISKNKLEPPAPKLSQSKRDNNKPTAKKPEKVVLAPKPEIKKVKQPKPKPQKEVASRAKPAAKPVQQAPLAEKKVEPIEPVKLSPVEKLQKKYNEENPLTIGINSCTQGNYTDALIAFNSINDKSFKKIIYHMWALVELGKFSEARKISSDLNKKDAFADLLLGRVEASADKDRSALIYYEEALLKPSIIKNRVNIRKDALYYIALIHDKHYGNSPSSETYKHTKNAWKNLKKVYHSTPDHPRFKLANKKLASMN
jgi:hypothetical protein